MSNPAADKNDPRDLMPSHVEPPRLERWLGVMLFALIPAGVMPFVPSFLKFPLAIAAAALVVVGSCILFLGRARDGAA